MELFFMRHGVAEAHTLHADDYQRPLTKEGRQYQRLVVEILAPLLKPLDHLLSSPLLRARQTAEIVAETIEFAGDIEQTDVLGEGCTLRRIRHLLKGYSQHARILCVGHEPSMSRLSAAFLDGDGRSMVAFQPGSMISLSFSGHPVPGQARLRFFAQPQDVLSLYKRA